MNFHELKTWYTLDKKTRDRKDKQTWRDFYREQLMYALMNAPGDDRWQGLLSPANLASERSWYDLGKPYYKIYPGVFDPFIATRLDISTDYLRAPHKAFAILFPKLDEPLLSFRMTSGVWHVTSILVEDFTADEIAASNEITKTDGMKVAFPRSSHQNESRGIIKIRIDFESEEGFKRYLGEVEGGEVLEGRVQVPSVFFRNIEVLPHTTIETSIGQFIDIASEETGDFSSVDPADEIVPAEIIEACFRLVIGIYFISTGSQKVLEYDVLSKHLTAYQDMKAKGDEGKCRDYERKARDKGKFGWTVGRDRHGRNLVLPKGVTYEDAVKQAGGQHLLYQHERGAHWHLYWTGEGRRIPVVKWVEETTVRADLPVKPVS